MPDKNEGFTPLIIVIDDDEEVNLPTAFKGEATSGDDPPHVELAAKDISRVRVHISSDGSPRRRPGVHASEANSDGNEVDSDDDDDARDEQPALSIELHWTVAVVIQILTACVAVAVTFGLHEFFHAKDANVTMVAVFGALLLGGFWTASGLVLTYRRCQANKQVQIVVLAAPLVYVLLVPLILTTSLPTAILLSSTVGIICYMTSVAYVGRCLGSGLQPKVACIHTYKFLLLVQLVLSIAFWFECLGALSGDWHSDRAAERAVVILNFTWMLFVRMLLFLDIKSQILDAVTDPHKDSGSDAHGDALLLERMKSPDAIVETV